MQVICLAFSRLWVNWSHLVDVRQLCNIFLRVQQIWRLVRRKKSDLAWRSMTPKFEKVSVIAIYHILHYYIFYSRYTYLYLSLLFSLIRNYLSVNVKYNYLIKQRPLFSDVLIINNFKNPKVPPSYMRCIRMCLNSKHKNNGYRGIFRLALKYLHCLIHYCMFRWTNHCMFRCKFA